MRSGPRARPAGTGTSRRTRWRLLESLAQMPDSRDAVLSRTTVLPKYSRTSCTAPGVGRSRDFPQATRTALYVLAARQSRHASGSNRAAGLKGSLADLAPSQGRRPRAAARWRAAARAAPAAAVGGRGRDTARRGVRVHRASADHCEGPRRAWHWLRGDRPRRAGRQGNCSSVRPTSPDPGAYRVAARALGRAADAPPRIPAVRAERSSPAASEPHAAGRADSYTPAASRRSRCGRARSSRRRSELVRGRALRSAGPCPARAADELLRAAEAVPPPDRRRAAALYVEAALPALLANRIPLMLTPPAGPSSLSTATGTVGGCLHWPSRRRRTCWPAAARRAGSGWRPPDRWSPGPTRNGTSSTSYCCPGPDVGRGPGGSPAGTGCDRGPRPPRCVLGAGRRPDRASRAGLVERRVGGRGGGRHRGTALGRRARPGRRGGARRDRARPVGRLPRRSGRLPAAAEPRGR